MGDKKRIAVIFGGQSSEHEVSRASAESVLKNIDSDKYEIEMLGITKDGRWLSYDGPVGLIGSGEWQLLAETKAIAKGNRQAAYLAGEQGSLRSIPGQSEISSSTYNENCDCLPSLSDTSARGILKAAGAEREDKRIDVVFPVLHGCNGEDGTIQGLFELAGIPYVGCGVLGSALGMDKGYAKIVFEKEGIPQGKYIVFTRKQISRDEGGIAGQVETLLTYPCFVKPSNAGSSVGVSKAHDRRELIEALHFAARFDRRVLVEEFIDGSEVECAVLGNDEPVASAVGEVVPCNEFYDYEAKYNSEGNSTVIIPAQLPDEIIKKIRDYAVRAFKALDLSGLSRVDFFVNKNTGKVFINEVNTLPGFTSISMYPKLWEASGIPYPKLIEKLIDLAIERFEDSKRDIGN
ncbi:MAG: D-alanine--D-alanine ligase [Ruminiclostridium sp.]|nr:D-alanine--D-alanine ligase [Ruminiclostridium sp.]